MNKKSKHLDKDIPVVDYKSKYEESLKQIKALEFENKNLRLQSDTYFDNWQEASKHYKFYYNRFLKLVSDRNRFKEWLEKEIEENNDIYNKEHDISYYDKVMHFEYVLGILKNIENGEDND